ncbi:MAG: hypothetical protein KAI83_18300 [Thiomargarita sp.]|nr:hypothetical protein [Thiomargarita sp.]
MIFDTDVLCAKRKRFKNSNHTRGENVKQKRDRYEMHKYWGKKPSTDLNLLISKYTKEGDTVLDPFSGYGVFCCEAFLNNRNVISNDLNPIANFINAQLLEKNIDLDLLKRQWLSIKTEFEQFNNRWFEWEIDKNKVQLSTILRDKNNIPIKAKYRINGKRTYAEITFKDENIRDFLDFEKEQEIIDWFPDNLLINNSRISAKKGMKVSDIFTKRTLSCHARLLSLIEKYSSGKEEGLLKLAFTANLANCSKLVPPIKSRGEMAPGAWMTGFYIGDTYLENNVLLYFENRLKKVIDGKKDYLNAFQDCDDSLFSVEYNNDYKITQQDAKHLKIESESIDYIFTDPPYGEAVPYFEQSVIWNSWLQLTPDYKNEIVISNSKERKKNNTVYQQELDSAFSEIRRVLKFNKLFSLTYHSLSGMEWKALTNACIKNGFELVDFKWLVQKTFTPRQLNRVKTIKGDVLVTLRKTNIVNINEISDQEVLEILKKHITCCLDGKDLETNEIFLKVMELIFTNRILIKNIDLLEVLSDNFIFTDNHKWRLKNEYVFHRVE